MVEIIDPQQTALSPEHIPPVEGAVDMVVHRADEQYRFLHDNAVVWHVGASISSPVMTMAGRGRGRWRTTCRLRTPSCTRAR